MAVKKYTSKYFTNAEIDQVLENASEGSVTFGQDTEGDDTIMRVFSVGPNEDRDYRKNKWFEVRNSDEGFTEDTKEIEAWCLGKWRIGKPYTMTVTLTTSETNTIRSTDTGNYVRFTFETVDSAGNPVSEGVRVTWVFDNNGATQRKETVALSGEEAFLNVDQYLASGKNTINITVTGTTTGTSVISSVTYNVVQLDLSSTFKTQAYKGSSITVPWEVESSTSDTKYVKFRVDGVEVGSPELVTTTDGSGNRSIDISTLTAGVHQLEIFAYILQDGDKYFYSKTLYREFCKEGSDGKFIMIGIDLVPGTFVTAGHESLVIPAEQYVDNTIEYGFYSTIRGTTRIVWTLGDESLHTDEADIQEVTSEGKTYELTFQPQKTGKMSLTATVDGVENSYVLLVNVNASGIVKTVGNCVLDLSARSRSNSEPANERQVWQSNGIKAQFPSGWAWSEKQGWADFTHTHTNTETGKEVSVKATALVVSGGKQVTIPLAALSNSPHIYGVSIELDYEVVDIDNPDTVVFSCYGKNTGTGQNVGLQVTAQSVTAQSTDGQMYTTFASNERNHLAFVVFPTDSASMKNLAFLYMSGTYERCLPYSTARWTTDAQIVLGSATGEATLRVYNLRVHYIALSVSEYLWNQAIDGNVVTETYNRNNIYKDGAISPALVQNKISVVLVDGRDNTTNNLNTLENTVSKSVKVRCDAQYISCDNKERNFTWKNGIWWLQGTSSLRYPRKNFKTRSYKKNDAIECKDYQNNTITKGLIQVVDGDMPCNEFIFKADFMDSSCTRNATVARLFGDIEPLISTTDASGNRVVLTPPQLAMKTWEKLTGKTFPYNIRTTPNAEAIMLFHRVPGATQYTCMGQYTMLNDKGNEELYGFKSIYAPAPGHYDDTDLQWLYTDPCCQKVTDTYRKALLDAGRIVRVYDNDDTHCYEILNNDEGFANFDTIEDWDTEVLIDTDDKWKHLNIENSFDSRYEEIDDDDYSTQAQRTEKAKNRFYPLIAFIWWIKNTKDLDNELEDHLRLYNCADYKVYYDRFGAVDQIMKNMMWTTYGEHSGCTVPEDCPEELAPYFDLKWMPIVYDNDSTVDKRNTGSVFFNYEFDRQTEDKNADDPEETSTKKYCYKGHESNLWNTLEASEAFMKMYRQQDQAFYEAGLKIANVLSYYDDKARSKWPEQAYNENMFYKYISLVLNESSTEEQKGWISFLQGMDKAHMHWWLINRFTKIDADNSTGAFSDKYVTFIGDSVPAGTVMNFVAGATTRFGWAVNKVTKPVNPEGDLSIAVEKGESFSITTDTKLTNGDPVYINGANKLRDIDLSNFAKYFESNIDFLHIFNVEGEDTVLKKVVLGVPDASATNRNTATDLAIDGLTKATKLEYLDIQGLPLTSYGFLEYLTALKTLKAKFTTMKTFKCADGTEFDLLELPDTLTGIEMSNGNWTKINYTPNTSLNTVNLSYMNDEDKNPNVKQFVFDWLDMLEDEYGMTAKWSDFSLILTGIQWTNVPYKRLQQLMNLGSCKLSGSSYIKCSNEFDSAMMTELMSAFGDSIFTPGAPLVIDCVSDKLTIGISASETETDAEGRIIIKETTTATAKATGFGNLKTGTATNAVFSITEANHPGVDITSAGVLTTTERCEDLRYYTIHAYDTNTFAYGDLIIGIKPLTYPTAASIYRVLNSKDEKVDISEDGEVNIIETGTYRFYRKFTPSGTTGSLKSSKWTYSGTDVSRAHIASQTSSMATLQVDNVGGEDTETMKYWACFNNIAKDPTSVGITSPAITVNIFSETDVLINNDGVGGNENLYKVVLSTIQADDPKFNPKKTNTLSSSELRLPTSLTLSADCGVKNFTSLSYNVLSYLKNVITLTCTDCATLTGDVDVTHMPQLVNIDLSGTSTQNATGLTSKPYLASLKLHAPTALTIHSCPKLVISEE